MSSLSSLDLQVRLQLSGQKYSEILSKYIDGLKYGKRDNILLQTKLTLLGIYIELLQTYSVDECNYDQTNNCLTEEDAQLLANKISQLTNICFQPLGFKYIGNIPQSGIGKMQIGCNFVVS